MNFRGIEVGKVIETVEDLMAHSYPLAGRPVPVDTRTEPVEEPTETKSDSPLETETVVDPPVVSIPDSTASKGKKNKKNQGQ